MRLFLSDLLSQTWANLRANKLRTFLTMFGIVWGVISFLLLSALGEGFARGNQKVLEEHKHTLVIPESAIIYDAKRNASVDLYRPGATNQRERRPIKVGVSNGTRTQVLNGLSEGQRVVLQ